MLSYTHESESVCGCDFSVVGPTSIETAGLLKITSASHVYTVRCSNILETAAIRCGSVFRCIISSKSCQQRILKNGLQLLPKLWPWVKCLVFIGIQNILRCSTTKNIMRISQELLSDYHNIATVGTFSGPIQN